MNEQEIKSKTEAFKEKYGGGGFTCETTISGNTTLESCSSLGGPSCGLVCNIFLWLLVAFTFVLLVSFVHRVISGDF